MKDLLRLILLAGLAVSIACGDGGGSSDDADPQATGDGDGGDGDAGDGDGAVGDGDAGDGDAPADPGPLMYGGHEPAFLEEVDGWEVMLTADWELESGVEGYWCARVTLDEDVYFNSTKPLSPLGTHHTLLSLEDEPTEADGIEPCNAGTNGPIMIAGSGVGTEELTFPEGVAVLAPKGSQVVLNLHLFNPTEETLRGRSGTLIKSMKEADVENLAVTTLAGPLDLDIPVGRVTQSGTCTFNTDVTLVAVGPHMHQTGVYLKAVARSSVDGDVVLYDGDYDFEEQRVYVLDEVVELKAGDVVDVECTYENDTGKRIEFGDSSFSEMCFAGLSHFPNRDTTNFICAF